MQKISKMNNKYFEFIFQGSFDEYLFFRETLLNKIPDSGLLLAANHIDEYHLTMVGDNIKIFEAGMILGACYAKFGHLKNTIFDI